MSPLHRCLPELVFALGIALTGAFVWFLYTDFMLLARFETANDRWLLEQSSGEWLDFTLFGAASCFVVSLVMTAVRVFRSSL